MIPAYIIDRERERQERESEDNRIGIQIPDYTAEYIEWKRKKEQEQSENTEDNSGTVIVIDII